MFIGHFALGFGAKRFAPTVSLGTAFLAVQLADLIWPNLVLLGIERLRVDPGNTAFTPISFDHYPYSHSLVAVVLWGVLYGALYKLGRRAAMAAAAVVGALVFSHWVLDFVSHRPDLPLTIGGEARVGLGLWNSVPGTVMVEVGLLAAGLALYLQQTRARDRIGSVGLWALVSFLLVVNVVNMVGPPPPSAVAIAWTAQAMWLLVAWGYWVDAHRDAVMKPRP